MFQSPFDFEGRIRRTEYGLTIIINFLIAVFLQILMVADGDGDGPGGIIAFFILGASVWFSAAQGAKRCHDYGETGWMQLIPFYPLYMVFNEGDAGPNKYGENPKVQTGASKVSVTYSGNKQDQPKRKPDGQYSGGYDGGHNNPGTKSTDLKSQSSTKESRDQDSDGYKDGGLYN